MKNASTTSWILFLDQLARILGFCKSFTRPLWRPLKRQKMRLGVFFVLNFIALHLLRMLVLKYITLLMGRDCGLRQILSFARFGSTWVNMGEWVRYFFSPVWSDDAFLLCSHVPLYICKTFYYGNLRIFGHWTDFERTSQILSKRRWYRWSKERNPTFGSICNWDSNVYWDQE